LKNKTIDIVTPEKVYQERRILLKQLAALSVLPISSQLFSKPALASELTEQITPEKLTTSYNNYLEFTDNKKMVKHISKDLSTNPWELKITGLVENPITVNVKALLAFEQVKRIYSLRCVEGWSAVIPWSGVMLKDILNLVTPQKEAKFVKLIGHYEPTVMLGQRSQVLNWPYTEGLRLDEAMHPLTLIATGMYDKPLPSQNGAPIRLVVPWKYGYKSIKAIREIQLIDSQPATTWEQYNASEYGFYGNVNPEVAHPRWSQRKEVRLGEIKKRRTQMLNGYGELARTLYKNDVLNLLV
jgi:sulfoxide reductase catalytic subunit YedY